MKYRIYFKNKPTSYYEKVTASSYNATKDFVDFHIIVPNSGDYINIASYKSDLVSKIICEDQLDKNEQRSKKLNRILKEKWWKKFRVFN